MDERPGAPTAEPLGWLTWAKELAGVILPYSAGYPNLANDGPYETSSIPFGGPYGVVLVFLPEMAPNSPPGQCALLGSVRNGLSMSKMST
jgi:hypothetical protein